MCVAVGLAACDGGPQRAAGPHPGPPQVATRFVVWPDDLTIVAGDSAAVHVVAFLANGDTLRVDSPATGQPRGRWLSRDTLADTTVNPFDPTVAYFWDETYTRTSTLLWIRTRGPGQGLAVIDWGAVTGGSSCTTDVILCPGSPGTWTDLLGSSPPIAVHVTASAH